MSHSQPAGQQLSVNDLGVVMEELNNVSAKWYNIGLQLGVSVGTLKTIKKQYSDPSDCLRETLTTWLQTCVPPPTWTNIVGALERSVVVEARLAADLEHKYCSSRPAPSVPVTSQLTAPQLSVSHPAVSFPPPQLSSVIDDCTPPNTPPAVTTHSPNPELTGLTTDTEVHV